MITQLKQNIDTMDKIGALIPQLDASWGTRYPLYNGFFTIGSYRIPSNKKFMLRSISVHAEYKNIQMTNAMGGFALGTLYFKLNGTIKMEYRLQWSGGTFNAVASDTSFGYNWRAMGGLKGLSFTAGDVITLEVSPTVSAGLVPQVRWAGQMVWKKSDGGIDGYKFDQITTLGTANQQIASYTVPTGDASLQHFGIEGISSDFMMGVVQVSLDGNNILTCPMFSSGMMTRPVPINLPFLGGLLMGEGQEIQVTGDFTHALNQTVQAVIMGEEIAYGSGGASEVSYVF